MARLYPIPRQNSILASWHHAQERAVWQARRVPSASERRQGARFRTRPRQQVPALLKTFNPCMAVCSPPDSARPPRAGGVALIAVQAIGREVRSPRRESLESSERNLPRPISPFFNPASKPSLRDKRERFCRFALSRQQRLEIVPRCGNGQSVLAIERLGFYIAAIRPCGEPCV